MSAQSVVQKLTPHLRSKDVHLFLAPSKIVDTSSLTEDLHAILEPQLLPLPEFLSHRILWPWPNRAPNDLLHYVDETGLLQPLLDEGGNMERHPRRFAGIQHYVTPLLERMSFVELDVFGFKPDDRFCAVYPASWPESPASRE